MRYKFEGIGEASAAIILAGLAANPGTAFLTKSILGKIIFFIAKLLCMYLASLGLIIMNVGAAKLETIIRENKFDDVWNDSEKLIELIRSTGRELTEDEIKQIDGPVIDVFRKFASFGRVRKRRDT